MTRLPSRAAWCLALGLAVVACSSGEDSEGSSTLATDATAPTTDPESTATDEVTVDTESTDDAPDTAAEIDDNACAGSTGERSVAEGEYRRQGENRQVCLDGRWVADPVLDTSTTVPTDDELAAATIGSGTYVVPGELQFGFYRVAGGWTVRDAGGAALDADAVDPTSVGFSLLSVGTDAATVEIDGEAVGLDFVPVFDPIAEGAVQGTYLVGTDVAPGTYRVTAPDGAAAMRLALAESGEWEIIEELAGADVTITIEPADFAIRFIGALEPV